MDVDNENARWSNQDGEDGIDTGVVWCDSPEALLQAVGDGKKDIEIGGHTAEGAPLMKAIGQSAMLLRSLSLTGCDLSAGMLMQLGFFLAPTKLWGIGVSNNPGIDVAVWAEFWRQLPLTVEKFDFGDNKFGDAALPQLVRTLIKSGSNGPCVQELCLDGNCITDISLLLPVVSECFGLTELDLGDNSIGDAQVQALAPVLPGSAVTSLVLGRNPLGDTGAIALSRVLPRTEIEVLHLDSTQIGDATLDALVASLAGSRLVELHIDETKVSDPGMLRLCKALPSSRIQLLDANDNDLSDETIAAIEAAIPQDSVIE